MKNKKGQVQHQLDLELIQTTQLISLNKLNSVSSHLKLHNMIRTLTTFQLIILILKHKQLL
jgi:hypothetical protein